MSASQNQIKSPYVEEEEEEHSLNHHLKVHQSPIESTQLKSPYVRHSLNDTISVNQSRSNIDSSNNREARERSDAEDRRAQFLAMLEKANAEAHAKFEAEVSEKLAALPDTERGSIGARERVANELRRRDFLRHLFKNQ